MTSFIAELFITIHNIHVYTIGKILKFEWHDLLEDFDSEKSFVWYSSIVVVALHHEFQRFLYSGKQIYYNKWCVKLVLKRFDDLLYIKADRCTLTPSIHQHLK